VQLYKSQFTVVVINMNEESILGAGGYAAMGKLNLVINYFEEFPNNLQITDANQLTPLHWACWGGAYDVASYLLNQGANVHLKDKFGRASIHLAFQNSKLLQLLLENGAKVNDTTEKFGYTPLHLACSIGCFYNSVIVLLRHEADIYCQDKWGKTPFEHAQHDKIKHVFASYRGSQIMKVLHFKESLPQSESRRDMFFESHDLVRYMSSYL
jgi:ankyrin repeat protein